MGKSKFTPEEGKKIIKFIQKWRKENPSATEWPLDELQQKLSMYDYSREQIRNKIATLQKSERIKGSSNYEILCLRQATPRNSDRTRSCDKKSNNLDAKSDLKTKLELVRKLFLTVDPLTAFGAWFQLEVHSKTKLGENIGETWKIICQYWKQISNGIPTEVLKALSKCAKGTKFSSLLFGDVEMEDESESERENPQVPTSSDDDDIMDESSEPLYHSTCNLDSSSTTLSNSDTMIETDKNSPPVASTSEITSVNVQIPSKYMVLNDWNVPRSNELEPTCSMFFKQSEAEFPDSQKKWQALIPLIINYPNIWSQITSDETWKALLNKANLKCDLDLTKLEFFRDVLPKRETFFDMKQTKIDMNLKLYQKESLNVVFHSLYLAKKISDFQSLYDDGILCTNIEWHKWVFVLKSKLSQNDSTEYFGANEAIQSVVNERLCSLIFNDGMKIIYNTDKGRPIIERMIRSIYAANDQF